MLDEIFNNITVFFSGVPGFFALLGGFFETVFITVGDFIANTVMFFLSLPLYLLIPVFTVLLAALVGAAAAYVKSFFFYNPANARAFYRVDIKTNETLLRGYFFKPGFHHITKLYEYTSKTLKGYQAWFGLTYLKVKLGDFAPRYKLLVIPLTPFYLVLFVLSIPEIVLRFIFGYIILFAATAVHFLIVIICTPLFGLLVPIFKNSQKIFRKSHKLTFACPICHRRCEQPYYACPKCGNVHKTLEPGLFGIISTNCAYPGYNYPVKTRYIFGKSIKVPYFSKSICNAKLPLYMTAKDNLTKICPYCGELHETGSSHNRGIQLVGASKSGKTAFLAAFWHLYFDRARKVKELTVKLTPIEKFRELEDNYDNGISVATSEKNAVSYSAEHFFGGNTSENFTVYDIAGEAFENEDYAKIQEQYSYCDGVIFIIDPLSSHKVRLEYGDSFDSDLLNRADTSPDTVISSFIDEFKKQKSIRADKVNSIPVSVVISKADVASVKDRIGQSVIEAAYNGGKSKYRSYDEARNSLCREYLNDIDMGDVVNMIDLNFKNSAYYPVSAMGHSSDLGAYEPYGVLEVFDRLIHGRIHKIIKED